MQATYRGNHSSSKSTKLHFVPAPSATNLIHANMYSYKLHTFILFERLEGKHPLLSGTPDSITYNHKGQESIIALLDFPQPLIISRNNHFLLQIWKSLNKLTGVQEEKQSNSQTVPKTLRGRERKENPLHSVNSFWPLKGCLLQLQMFNVEQNPKESELKDPFGP